MLSFLKRLFLGKGGDVFNLCLVVGCVLLAFLGAYWIAALVFGIVAAVASRLFRWPMEKLVIPLCLALQIGKNRFTAWLGLLAVGACLALAVCVVRELQSSAVRRIGQNLETLKNRLPEEYAAKVDALAIEGLGTNRFNRINAWLWEKDMAVEDARFAADGAVTSALLAVSEKLDAWGGQLENRVFEGERRQWFVYVYWFAVAALAPMLIAAFIITVYQLSARRVASNSNLLTRALVSLTTFALLYFLLSAFYLVPYVSHPLYAPGVPFWVSALLYVVGGAICCGVVRVNHRLLFADGDVTNA